MTQSSSKPLRATEELALGGCGTDAEARMDLLPEPRLSVPCAVCDVTPKSGRHAWIIQQ